MDQEHSPGTRARVKLNWEKKIVGGGEAKELGERWLAGQKAVFELWHRFKRQRTPASG